MEPAVENGAQPYVALDKQFYGMIDDFEERLPVPPSLRDAERFVVNGDVHFGAGVVVRGEVELDAPDGGMRVDDGALLGES